MLVKMPASMPNNRDEATRATRLAALDAQEDVRRIPPGSISPTHVTDDDIYIQFNARFRPVAGAPEDEMEEDVEEQAIEVSEG